MPVTPVNFYLEQSTLDQEGLSLCHTEPFHHTEVTFCAKLIIMYFFQFGLEGEINVKCFCVYTNLHFAHPRQINHGPQRNRSENMSKLKL